MIRFNLLLAILVAWSTMVFAQQQRWQQGIQYEMEIDMDEKNHQFSGTQKVVYQNNSNEDLTRFFYHLYFNAFQPGSMMDVRSRTIRDADPRVGSRILGLKKEEIGYHKIKSLKQNGTPVKFKVEETILVVELNEPIKAGASATFEMEFESQVPLQVRRSGWKSKEGIEFSMTQWYPKVSEYDYQGWHSNPYVGREFHGVWGSFDVKITMDKKYVLGGTGLLQNPNTIGHGYQDLGVKVDHSSKSRLTWHFKAENVHDFAWAADPDYIHDVVEVDEDLTLHFLYQDNEAYKETWKKAQPKTAEAFRFIQKRYGKYPYAQYSILQGGDGGMEYPMATLITGNRNFGSLVGVIVHEVMHTWYQMLMGSNESLYAWMDEGFTSYASNEVNAFLFKRRNGFVHQGSYKGYNYLAKSGVEEPLRTHADHFVSNFAYGQAAYSKGAVFLGNINYIVGRQAFDKIMLKYYDAWHFKHPNPNDFIRIVERTSGLELDWYKEYWVNTTHHIDYAITDVLKGKKPSKDSIVIKASEKEYLAKSVKVKGTGTRIYLEKKGGMPMPLEVVVTYKNKKNTEKALYYIPTVLMRGEKQDEVEYGVRTIMPDWPWTNSVYELNIPIKLRNIEKIEIDPSLRMADIDRKNNTYER